MKTASRKLNLTRMLVLRLMTCALLLAGASACTSREDGAQGARPEVAVEGEATTGEASSIEDASASSTPAVPGVTKQFEGSIGGKLRFKMKLVRAGEKLWGTYSYLNSKGGSLTLKGSFGDADNFTLQEFDAGDFQTGLFKGRWSVLNDGDIKLAGNWSKPDGTGGRSFTAEELPISFSGSLDIVSRKLKDARKKPKYTIEIDYPQLEGAEGESISKFNARAKSMTSDWVEDFRKNVLEAGEMELMADVGSSLGAGYEPGFGSDDLVSILFHIETYYQGAAHGNHHTEVLNFDLKAGRVLKLSDLFDSPRYLQVISDYCIRDLKRQGRKQGADSMLMDDWISEGASAKEENYHSWLIRKDGLLITFDPYSVAAYAAGPQEVKIPYSALRGIIGAESVLARFVKG